MRGSSAVLTQYGDIPILPQVSIKLPAPKPCIFVGSSRKDLLGFPPPVRRNMGHALHQVQSGGEPLSAKALKGFSGRAIREVIDDFDGDTFRAVYTVRFAGVVYVLHAFQKKSKKGVATPKRDIELIKARLRDAEELHRTRSEQGGRKP
jgi:phage-related protein